MDRLKIPGDTLVFCWPAGTNPDTYGRPWSAPRGPRTAWSLTHLALLKSALSNSASSEPWPLSHQANVFISGVNSRGLTLLWTPLTIMRT